MAIESYQDLTVWRKAMDLATLCYRLTQGFPKEEAFGMTSQIRRAAASIPANIAEGWGRGTTGEYLQFLRIAQGSAKELETHLLLCVRVELLREERADPALELLAEISRMTIALMNSLKGRVK